MTPNCTIETRNKRVVHMHRRTVLLFAVLAILASASHGQLIVPKEVPAPGASPAIPPREAAPSRPAAPAPALRDSRQLLGEWTGTWTNGDKVKSFVLRIKEGKDQRGFSAEGKADGWTVTETFEGSIEGKEVVLNGTEVQPPPPPGKYYSLDILSLTLSPDGRTLAGSWEDHDNSSGTVSLTRRSDASNEPKVAAPDAANSSVSADAKEAIDTAFRTGSTKAFLTKAVPTRLRMWGEAAEQGIPEGLWLVGCCYDNGVGVETRDPSRAFQCYLAAAEKDYGPALNDVGLCYAKGSGTGKDLSRAVTYFQRAADKGRPGAWYNLGSMYEQGLGGLPKDVEKAVACYRKAKELGYALAGKALAALGR